jgi:hypothetical protein
MAIVLAELPKKFSSAWRVFAEIVAFALEGGITKKKPSTNEEPVGEGEI